MDNLTHDHEKATLGAMIAAPGVVPELAQKVNPTDFFEARHQLIFQVIIEDWANGVAISPLTVAERLRANDDLSRVGGLPYLFGVLEAAPVPSSAVFHADKVAEHAARRRLVLASEVIGQKAQTDELGGVIAEARELIDNVYRSNESSVNLIGDTIGNTLDHIVNVMAGEVESGIPSGFHDLDELTNGFSGGQMIIVAARPGVGKSTLATDFMRHMSVNLGHPTLIFSLEMSEQELHTRLISAETKINTTKIKSGNLTPSEYDQMVAHMGKLAEAPIYIDDSTEITMLDIISKTKTLVAQHGVKLMVVDYLQLLKSGSKIENRQQEVSEFSRQLKLLAKSCDIPVVAIAQLNRGPEMRGDGALPKISDLRESGSLEQDADMVILLNRPDSQDPNHLRAGETDIILAKHRGGPIGTVTVGNQLHYSKFVNMPRGF